MKAIRRFFPLAFVLFFYFVFFIRCGPGEKTPGFCEAMGFKCLEMLCPPIYDYSDGVVKSDDVGDGTIQVSVTTKGGTRCSPRNSVRTFFVKKCLQGQIFQAGTGDCKGGGNAGNNYGALLLQFCTTNDNSCQTSNTYDYSPANPLTSPAAASCAADATAGKTWKMLDTYDLKTVNLLSINPDLPANPASQIWHPSSYSLTDGTTYYFGSGGSRVFSNQPKINSLSVLCATAPAYN